MRPHRAALALVTAAATALTLAPTAGAAAGAGNATSSTTGRLLVTLKAPDGARTLRAAGATIAGTGVEVAGPVADALRLVTVRPVAGLGMQAAATALRALPQVESVEVERRARLRFVPDDPALTTLETAPRTPPGVPVQWWVAGENLPALWDVTRGSGARVAVIDTGADSTHPELAGKIAQGIDNDATAGAGGAGNDEIGHGTHVASIACANAGNGAGITGAGLGCKVIVIKSDLSDSSIAMSIKQAVDAGADSINMSFGTDGSQAAATPIVNAIDYAVNRGVILVAAAADEPTEEQGDPSNVLQPTGSGSDITQGKGLSVTSADYGGARSPFAGLGSQVSIAAYGSFSTDAGPRGILAAFPTNTADLERPTFTSTGCGCRATFGGDNRYAYIQGTSMAAPMVAAVAALIRDLNPGLSARQVIQIMKQTATRPAGTEWTPDLGWGIVNGGNAAALARTIDATPPRTSVRSSTPKVVRGSSVTLRFNRVDEHPAKVVASGFKSLYVYRSTNGRKAVKIGSTTKSTFKVSIRRGSRYSFYTRGLDKAGNRETAPSRADVSIRGAAR
ncbi:protease [Paraconexibacter sp. AEG42_29]|uniref:Protease n=1 Tax=Paraconexibacter sp. AEG42_29 TaxID=2997339 RepID=A0AAU7AY66_9ACTN